MKYLVDHIKKSPSKRTGIKNDLSNITIHSTGNTATARQERAWLDNPQNTSSNSFHVVIDDKEAIECIPLDEIAHHTGSFAGNHTSIGIEMCEGGDREKVFKNTYAVTAYLLQHLSLDIGSLRMHRHWTKTQCPSILRDEDWLTFQLNILREMTNMEEFTVVLGETSYKVEGIRQNNKIYLHSRDFARLLGYEIIYENNELFIKNKLQAFIKEFKELVLKYL